MTEAFLMKATTKQVHWAEDDAKRHHDCNCPTVYLGMVTYRFRIDDIHEVRYCHECGEIFLIPFFGREVSDWEMYTAIQKFTADIKTKIFEHTKDIIEETEQYKVKW